MDAVNETIRAAQRTDTEVVLPKLQRVAYVDQGMELVRLMRDLNLGTKETATKVLESAASAYEMAGMVVVRPKE